MSCHNTDQFFHMLQSGKGQTGGILYALLDCTTPCEELPRLVLQDEELGLFQTRMPAARCLHANEHVRI